MDEALFKIRKVSTNVCLAIVFICLAFLYAKPVGELLRCVAYNIEYDACFVLKPSFVLGCYLEDIQYDIRQTGFIFYLRQLLKSCVLSSLLVQLLVQKTNKVVPLDRTFSIGEEPEVKCFRICKKHGISQTCSAYHKKRRRTNKKLDTLKDKTQNELKKIQRKRKKLCDRYWFRDDLLTKNIRCQEMLIGGLEIKKSSMEAHVIQLQYYITFSRDQLELQRDRNKIIQDNIDQCGRHVGSSNYSLPYQEAMARS